MYTIAICDDDKEYRETIKKIIKGAEIINEEEIQFYDYDSGKKLLSCVDVLHNLIFLDIRMPGIDGNRTAELLRISNKEAVIVFCSNYFEPTLESINIGRPFRYIMKDINDTNLKKEIGDILREIQRKHRMKYLTVTLTGRMIKILINDVLYISIAKRGSFIYKANNGKIEEIHCRETIKELYPKLVDEGFEYAHNSYVVNLEKVVDLNRTSLKLNGGIELNISRSKKRKFEEHFMQFLQKESGKR